MNIYYLKRIRRHFEYFFDGDRLIVFHRKDKSIFYDVRSIKFVPDNISDFVLHYVYETRGIESGLRRDKKVRKRRALVESKKFYKRLTDV